MPIHPPGKRNRRGRAIGKKRKVMATLSLTAMIDMFSVLTVFLLNYSTTNQLVDVPPGLTLPEAAKVKELKPSHVVSITLTDVRVDKVVVAKLQDVKNQKDWMIPALFTVLKKEIDTKKREARADIRLKLSKVVKGAEAPPADPDVNLVKVTVQADKTIDFLTVKKVMFTVTEAGGEEINFAVAKNETPAATQ